jgi:hypothetical protein
LGSNNNSQQQQQQQKIFYVSVPVSALLFPLTHMPPFVTVSQAWLVYRLYRHRLLGLPKRILRLQGTFTHLSKFGLWPLRSQKVTNLQIRQGQLPLKS